MPGTNTDIRGLGGFVWSIAEILRGDFKQSEYGKVILPFIVLRRLDCILDASKQDVLEAAKRLSDAVDDPTRDMILFAAAGKNTKVYNLSAFTFESLKAQEPGQLQDNLIDYITKFSGNVRDTRLTEKGIIRQVRDLACGTSGMLALTGEAPKAFNPSIRVEPFGQELNGESFGICKSDMPVTGHDPERITFGNTLTNDAHNGKSFHCMLSNPPCGVHWKKHNDCSR